MGGASSSFVHCYHLFVVIVLHLLLVVAPCCHHFSAVGYHVAPVSRVKKGGEKVMCMLTYTMTTNVVCRRLVATLLTVMCHLDSMSNRSVRGRGDLAHLRSSSPVSGHGHLMSFVSCGGNHCHHHIRCCLPCRHWRRGPWLLYKKRRGGGV